MKLKDGVILSEVDGEWIAVDAGVGGQRFNGLVRLNKTAAFVVRQMKEEVTIEDIVAAMTEHFDVTAELARQNAEKVIETLQSVDLFL